MNLRRFILMFIICISSFMIYTNNVNAQTYSTYKHFTDNYIICASGYDWCEENLNIMNNKGNLSGDFMFSFVVDPQIILNSVMVTNSNGTYFPCNIGNQTIYRDNTTGYNLYTAVCPMNITNDGVLKVRFEYDSSYLNQNNFKFYVSDYYSFTYDPSTLDYSSILQNIYNSVNSLNTALGGKLDNQTTIITNIYNQVTNTNTKLDAIKSKLDSIKNNASATASNTEQIKNDIKDSSIDNNNTSASASQWSSKNASNGTITQLLTLPISLLTNITNSINSTCTSFSLGTLFDTELVLPCINLSNYLGSALVSIIDILFSGFMIYNIAKKLIKIFNDFTNLKSNQIDEIYGGGNE